LYYADEAAGTDGDPHKDDIEYDEFNKLGTPASLGCIRLMVCDVKWIYDNCDIGTRVIIYDDAEDPGPMGKPRTISPDPADETRRGWNPTDPDPANPWDDRYLSGTTIRSEAAWQEWNDAMADGRWNVTLTPTDLQGWSTDSSIEGTRGELQQAKNAPLRNKPQADVYQPFAVALFGLDRAGGEDTLAGAAIDASGSVHNSLVGHADRADRAGVNTSAAGDALAGNGMSHSGNSLSPCGIFPGSRFARSASAGTQ